VADTYWRATWQPRVGGADAPVLVGLAAVGGASVIPLVIDRGSDWPGGSGEGEEQEREAKEFVHLGLVPVGRACA
jgi:hypothetical protein